VAPAVPGVGQEGILHALAGHRVAHDEVAVGDRGLVRQAEVCRGTPPLDLHLVKLGAQVQDGAAGLQGQLQRDVVSGPGAFGGDRRGDARGVRNLPGVGRPARALATLRVTRDVAGSHHHREDERVEAVLPGQDLGVADGDVHGGPGFDVGHRLGEDVGALLVQKRGHVPLLAGLLVDAPGLVAGFDQAADGPLPDLHLHVVDRCVLRQRERVEGLDLVLARVVEVLGHRDRGHQPRDMGLDGGVLQGALPGWLAVGAQDHQRPGALAPGRRSGVGRRGSD